MKVVKRIYGIDNPWNIPPQCTIDGYIDYLDDNTVRYYCKHSKLDKWECYKTENIENGRNKE